MCRENEQIKLTPPLLYRAAQKGIFGTYQTFIQGSITDALFVYLNGEPDPEAVAVLDAEYVARPWVCLTDSWEAVIKERYPNSEMYRRFAMKPARRFRIPTHLKVPDEYRLTGMDKTAFDQHPFSHGVNYSSYEVFCKEGSGAVVYRDEEIVASASSFLSMDGEVEMDVSTKKTHQGKGLAGICITRMLEDCMERGIIVHWDAQNEISRHLAEKFDFEIEKEYRVYYQPLRKE